MVTLQEAIAMPGRPLEQISLREILTQGSVQKGLVVVPNVGSGTIDPRVAASLDTLRENQSSYSPLGNSVLVPLKLGHTLRDLEAIGVIKKPDPMNCWVEKLDSYDDRNQVYSTHGGYCLQRYVLWRGDHYPDALLVATQLPRFFVMDWVYGKEYKPLHG